MKRVSFELIQLHSETYDTGIDLGDHQEVVSVEGGLIAGHASFNVVVATTTEVAAEPQPAVAPPKTETVEEKAARHDTPSVMRSLNSAGIQSAARAPSADLG